MVTYKKETKTWKFGPPYARGIYWVFEIVPIVLIILGIALILPDIILEDFKSLFSPPFSLGIFILLIAFIILVPGFLFVFSYAPKEVHMTYDQLVIIKDFIGISRRRIPYFQIADVELVYLADTENSPSLLSRIFGFSNNLSGKDSDKIYNQDRNCMVRIWMDDGKVFDLQVEDAQRFARMLRAKMKRSGVKSRVNR